MNTAEDGMGHVIVYCGWNEYAEEQPEETTPECSIVAIDLDDRYHICKYADRWCNVDTLDPVKVKYWIRIPSYPEED